MITLIVEAALRSCALGVIVWLILTALRVRNPQLERSAWFAVLLAAIAMPLLMQVSLLPPVPAPALLWTQYIDVATTPATAGRVPWSALLISLYVAVVALFLVRQVIGLTRLWLLRRSARALHIPDIDVRVSSELQSPANIFSTIIVPPAFESWDEQQQQAVLAHERAHVLNRDFYSQQFAQIHRSFFWFSPLAWWLPHRLSMLSEHISDDAALSVMPERTAYAELLLRFARSGIRNEHIVAMARPATLVTRVERILNDDDSPRCVSRSRRMVLGVALLPLIGIAGGFQATAADGETGNPVAGKQTPNGSSAPATSVSGSVMLPKSNRERPLSHPVYPPPSRRLLEQGTVVLKLHVTETGRVSDALVEKSSGFIELDNAARYESFRWQLDPGTIDGAPKTMWGQFAVTFKLED